MTYGLTGVLVATAMAFNSGHGLVWRHVSLTHNGRDQMIHWIATGMVLIPKTLRHVSIPLT